MATKVTAIEGDRHALYALKVFRQDPDADDLLKQFPYPRILGTIAANQWFEEPDEQSLAGMLALARLGSVRAVVEIIKPNLSLNSRQRLEKRRLLERLPESDKELIRGVLVSLAGGDRMNWFGSSWAENDAVGKVFFNGESSLGIKPDFNLAYAAFQQCSDSLSDLPANLCLFQQAFLKQRGGPGMMKSEKEALDLYLEAHERGNYTASAVLSDTYRFGDMGVERDLSRAAEFGILAVERGNPWAAERLAFQYLNGEGVQADPEQAAHFFEIAATEAEEAELNHLGSPRAMVALADLHEAAVFRSASLNRALFWFESARDADDSQWKQYGVAADEIITQKRMAKEGVDRVSKKLRAAASGVIPFKAPMPARTDFGSYKVLIIANQSYEKLTNLSTPKNDASLIGTAFESRFGAQVEYLFDVNRVEMLSALNRYRKELLPTDNFVLYYAGHGIYDEELNIGYWQPIDSTADEDYTWIDTDRISRTLSGFKSRNALVIADSCFSGSVVRGNEFATRSENSATALLALNAKKTRMAITSGGLQPVLDVTGNSKTSAFASNLTDVLNTVDRPVPISSLFPMLRSKVTAESAAWGFEQVPEMAPLYKAGHDGGDFILSPLINGRE